MRIQNITVCECEYPSLYFRGGELSDGRIFLRDKEVLSFDTYFGSFSYTKYRDYTTVTAIAFKGEISGCATVSLRVYDGSCERIVAESFAEGEFTLHAELSALPERAILYPVIVAVGDACFIRGEYTADAVSADISCAVAFCTFKREEYLRRNVKTLSEAKLPFIDKIIVVDNGNTISDDELPELAEVFPNPNFGGSAGFTRGIIEAKKRGFTHLILMDDDINIYPEAIERLTVFASILRSEYSNAHFSAAMLKASKIYIQHEKGALWNGSHIESLNTELDVRDRDSLIANLDDGPIGYGAWWCFCLPLADVDMFGLPLPLFIKFDDVEYGTRCCNNAPIITMSGMAVSHADFEGKYNMHLEYYTIRNQLIMLATHNMQNRFGCVLRLMKVSAKHLFLYRYDSLPILLRAFEDFLRGADFIINENAEELNRSVMSMTPATVPLSSIPEWNDEIRASFKKNKPSKLNRAMRLLLLGGHVIPNFLMKKDTVFLPLPEAQNCDCFMHKSTVQYQLASDNGYVFNKHSARFLVCFFKCVGMMFKILFGYGKAAKSFRESKDYLTGYEFWNKYLGLSDGK